jgi:multidrug efflux pump subunit AcrA (membrane-fusion protein)
VPQELMGKVKKGSKLYLVNGTERLPAEVARVYPALGRNLLGSLEVVLEQPPFGLPTGSTVGAELVTATVSGSIVPESALVKSEKGCFVCLVENGTVRVRPVELLGTGDGRAAVRGDLPADAVVAVGQENRLLTLSDGMPVTAAGGKP